MALCPAVFPRTASASGRIRSASAERLGVLDPGGTSHHRDNTSMWIASGWATNPPGAPVYGVRTSHSLTAYPGRIVFAIPQIATTATSRPEALTSRSMSSGSLVRIVAFCRRAVVTTTASTTSDVLVMPNSRPASCASISPSGTTTHPIKKRRSWACCGDRLTWATTGAGTNGTTPSSKRALCSAHARRSFLSAATRTAAS
jgi:hypothetical protein